MTPSGFASCEKELSVDPFLLEALQDPRHRFTILQMELDIQGFMRRTEAQEHEFEPFPTSYLRLAAQRVAQHYGLVALVPDNTDCLPHSIVVKKTPSAKFPTICLCEVSPKQPENERHKLGKIVIKSRPKNGFTGGLNSSGVHQSPLRSVEERKEEYDKARARIFNAPGHPDADDPVSGHIADSVTKDDSGSNGSSTDDSERCNAGLRENTTRVAIFKDKEKDRNDPDYDRSYGRYVKGAASGKPLGVAHSKQKLQPSFLKQGTPFYPFAQIQRPQASGGFMANVNPGMTPFGLVQSNQMLRDTSYLNWPANAMLYANSSDQFGHPFLQPSCCQHPLTFDYSQGH